MGVLYRLAGNKSRVMDQHFAHFEAHNPPPYRRWVEPCGGSWTMSVEAMRRSWAEEYVLGDADPDFVAVLQQLMLDPASLVQALREYQGLTIDQQHATFLELRLVEPKTRLQRAARLLILQGSSFNGLMRKNKQGHYNVPFGLIYRNKKTGQTAVSPPHFDLVHLMDVATLLRQNLVQVRCADFSETLAQAGPDDFAYADPPYYGTHSTFGAAGFDIHQHDLLAGDLREARSRGATSWVAGSDHPTTRDIYGDPGSIIFDVRAYRSMSQTAEGRSYVNELLIRM